MRRITESAYRAGAEFVEALWGDEALQLARFRNAAPDSFNKFSDWFPRALAEHVEAGHATLSVWANDPDLLRNQPSEQLNALQRTVSQAVQRFPSAVAQCHELVDCCGTVRRVADRVFADLPKEQRVEALWRAIAKLVRLDQPDPIAAWQTHLAQLAARRDFLNARRYSELRYRGPGTALTIGLVDGHKWKAGSAASGNGIVFTANLPTEEVFTMPHCRRVDGTVRLDEATQLRRHAHREFPASRSRLGVRCRPPLNVAKPC